MKYYTALYILMILVLLFLIGVGGCSVTNDDEFIAYVKSDKVGNTYIAWRLARSAGDQDVHLSKISPAGEILWDKTLFTGDDRRVNITGLVPNSAGGVFIGWDVLLPTNGKDGHHDFANSTLVNVNAQGDIMVNRDFSQEGMQMASDGQGGVLLFRYGWENVGVERVAENMESLWDCPVDIEMDFQRFIAGDNGTSFLFTMDPGDIHITLQKINADGQPMWGKTGAGFDLPSSDLFGEGNPIIFSDGAGGVFIAWASWISGDEGGHIGICHISADGGMTYNNSMCSLSSPSSGYIRAFANDSGESVIVWEKHDEDFGLHAQKVNFENEPLWSDNGVAVCTGLPRVSPRFESVSDGSGGVIVVWMDGNQKLYAQMLDHSGQQQWDAAGTQIAKDVVDQPIKFCSDNQDNIIIGWSVGKKSYIQKIDAEGRLIWGDNGREINSK